MKAEAMAELLIALMEIAKIGVLLAQEDRAPTQEEKDRMSAVVQRANDIWELVGK